MEFAPPSPQQLQPCLIAKRCESCSFVKVNLKIQRQSFQTVLPLKFLTVFLWCGIVLGTAAGSDSAAAGSDGCRRIKRGRADGYRGCFLMGMVDLVEFKT